MLEYLEILALGIWAASWLITLGLWLYEGTNGTPFALE